MSAILFVWKTNDKYSVHNVAVAKTNPPLFFIENQGQFNRQEKFYMQHSSYAIYFAENEIIYSSTNKNNAKSHIRQHFIGARKDVSVIGARKLDAKVHHLIGTDKKSWRQNIATYEEVVYQDIYEGIDLAFLGNEGKLKSEFRVDAGADYKKILMAYAGASNLALSDAGDLIVSDAAQELKEKKPIIYQTIGGKTEEVEGKFVVNGHLVRFEIGPHDATLPLIIDPELLYSVAQRGNEYDQGNGIAVDDEGNAYIVGTTHSSDFPATSTFLNSDGIDRSLTQSDAFITKLDPDGRVIFSTFLGGSRFDAGIDISVDDEDNIYVTGYTQSFDFPVLAAFQDHLSETINDGVFLGSESDVFVAKLSNDGSRLIYSTYFGGGNDDAALAIAVYADGSTVIAGRTNSTNFPVVSAFQVHLGTGGTWYPASDAFVTKFDSTGEIVFSTYLGGSDESEDASDVAVDADGNIYVVGTTRSVDFPLVRALRTSMGSLRPDAFVAKFNSTGAILFSTYLGGSNSDHASGIALNSEGDIYITGSTLSDDFSTVSALQELRASPCFTDGLCEDAFVTKVKANGAAIIYTTYLGGTSGDNGNGIAVDVQGNVHVVGMTRSPDFPTTAAAIHSSYQGGMYDVFVAKLNSDGSSLDYSTYLGGAESDRGLDIAVDLRGNAYVAADITGDSGLDVWIAKIGEPLPADLRIVHRSASNRRAGRTFSLNFTIINNGPGNAREVMLTNHLPAGLNFVSYRVLGGPAVCSYVAAEGIVRCSVDGILESGRRRFVTINVRSARSGTYLSAAEVSSGGVDPDASNNYADHRFSVSR